MGFASHCSCYKCKLKLYHFLQDNDNRQKCILPTYLIDNFHLHQHVQMFPEFCGQFCIHTTTEILYYGKTVFLFICEFSPIFLFDCRLSGSNMCHTRLGALNPFLQRNDVRKWDISISSLMCFLSHLQETKEAGLGFPVLLHCLLQGPWPIAANSSQSLSVVRVRDQ